MAFALAALPWLRRVTESLDVGRALARISIAIFGFYIFFAGWSQPWYLLPLLPMVPLADARWFRALDRSEEITRARTA